MSATFTARKLNNSPFVEFYRREGTQAPKRLPISPRLLSAPSEIRFSEKGEKVALTTTGNFPGNTMNTLGATGPIVWSRDERYMLMFGNAGNRARIYERYGEAAMLPQVNDDLLPVTPNFIGLAAFGGPANSWLFVRYNSDAATKVRVFRYGYSGFAPFQEITLTHLYSRIVTSESTIVFDNGGVKTIYRIEGTELVEKTLPAGLPASAAVLTVNPTGSTILYQYAATTVIASTNLADRYVTTMSYNSITGELVDDGITANRIGLNENFNNRNVIPGAGHAKSNVQIVVSGNGKTFALYSSALHTSTTPVAKATYSYYQIIVSVHEWIDGGTNATARHYFNRAGPYSNIGTGTRLGSGPDPKITPDGREVLYAYTDIIDNQSGESMHEMYYLHRGGPNLPFANTPIYRRLNDNNGRLTAPELWPPHGASNGGVIQARLYPTDAYGRRRAFDLNSPLPPTIPISRNFTSDGATGLWPWATDLLVDQATNIVYSPTGRYVVFKRNGVAPTTFEFRRNDLGTWNFAESYAATSVQVYDTSNPSMLLLQGAYGLPLNSEVKDMVFSSRAEALAFHASHEDHPEVNGRYVLELNGEVGFVGKESHGTRSRLAFSPKDPLVYFAASWDMAPDPSRVDLYKFNGPLTAFTNTDDKEGFFGPIAFSACDDVIVVHGGSTGIPFSLYNRNGDLLETRVVEGFEDFPAEVLDIKYLPDCSGLAILVPGGPGQPPKVVIIETIDDEETGTVIGQPPIELPLPEDPDAPPTSVDVGFAEDPVTGLPIIDSNGNPVISIVVQRENQDIVSPNSRPPTEGVPPLPNQGTGYDPWQGTDPNTGLPVPPAEGQPDESKKGLIFLDLTGKPVRDGGPEFPRELVDRTYPIAVSVNVGWEH